MAAICKSKTPPASREDSETANKVPWIILESIFSAAPIVYIIDLDHRLEVLVDREINTSLQDKFIRPLQERCIEAVDIELNIRVEVVL